MLPGKMVPHLICLTWFDGRGSGIFHWKEVETWITEKLLTATNDSPLVFHNAAFDLAVIGNQFPKLLPEVFKALDRNAIRDTYLRERLLKIAEGTLKLNRYSLKDLASSYLNKDLDKTTWRMSYGELKDVPLDKWEQGAIDYAISDTVCTGQIYELQQKHDRANEVFLDESNQCRYAFSLFLTSAWGLITDSLRVNALELRTDEEINSLLTSLTENGLVKPDGTRNNKETERLVLEANPYAKRTEPTKTYPYGKVKIDEDSFKDTKNPLLLKLARYRQLQTLLSKDVETLKRGTKEPLHTRFEPLLETGRTSSSKPNVQNPRREPGVRECYIPRPGNVYVSCDYSSAELITLAQTNFSVFGFSSMRDRLIEGKDLLLDFASQLLGIDYHDAKKKKEAGDDEISNARQYAKAAMYGFPGGMGILKFIQYAKGVGLTLTEDEVRLLKNRWLDSFPEMQKYFRWINDSIKAKPEIKQLFSNRIRGNVRFTEACNSYFQGLAADGAKDALYEVVKASYVDKKSSLYGSRPCNFIHDQIILETKEENAAEAAKELEKSMVETFKKWTPDVPVKAEACISYCWSKDAKPVKNEKGELIPWKEKESK